MTFEAIISALHELADPAKSAFKAQKYNIIANNSLGIYQQELKALAKRIPKDDQLAIRLFDSGIYEARLLCSKLFDPKNLTENLMEKWLSTFENWEICDSFCMGLFAKSAFAVPKSIEWATRTAEYEKRAAFATIAAYCMADKKSTNEVFDVFFPIILQASTDERLYVKKAVNWALRNLGKRNIDLNKSAIFCANEILSLNSKSAKWIASNALKELKKENVRMSDYPRAIYRNQ